MAKRKNKDLQKDEKRALNKANLKKILGIFRFILPYKRKFIIGLLALILSSVTLLSFPYFVGQLLDLALGKTLPFLSNINEAAILLIIILFVQSIFSFIRVYTFSVVSERGMADIRKAVYQKMMWLSMEYFDKKRVGELISRITVDVSTLQETFTTTIAELLRQVLTLIFGTAIILYLTPRLTFFMLLTFPVLIILAMVFGKFIRKLSRNTQDKLAEANIIVEESLHAISVVKAFTNELFEISRYAKSLQGAVSVAIRSALYRALFISFLIFALFGGVVVVIWYGANLTQSNEISMGSLLSFVFYTTFIAGSIAGIGDLYSQIQRTIGASERVLEMLDEKDEFPVSNENLRETRFNGAIEFENVSFSYPTRLETTVLQQLNLNIRPGEKVALVGHSGAGKSTVINLLMRFYSSGEGVIRVDERNILDYPLQEYRHNLGIVPQEVLLFGGTIAENIAYGKPGASREEIIDAAKKANAFDFIDGFPEKFKTTVGERGVKLSGGQRQRIAIARAILKNPSILILDEATSSLDAQSEVLVQEALEKLMEGRTTLIIAHRLSTIKKADRIFVISNGCIAEAGSHSELALTDGIYSKLLKLQLH